MNGTSFIFLDPARRDASGAKTVEIEHCTPNVLALKETLLQKCCVAIVKLSPMLDWHKALKSLNEGGPIVSEIHIVSVQNECKELLFVLQKNAPQQPQIYCVNDQQVMSYSTTENEVALQTISTEIEEHSEIAPKSISLRTQRFANEGGLLCFFCRNNMALRHFLLIVTSSFRPISSRNGMVESSRYKPFRV